MPKCGRCQKEVYKAEEIIAAGQTWHSDCFRCATCKTGLDSVTVRDKNKEIYCAHCYGKNFGPKGYGFGGGGGVGLRATDTVSEGAEIGSSGIDAEIQRKLNMKFDEEKEASARQWLQSLLGETFEEKTLQLALKSGERLCKAANKIAPGIVKNINRQKFAAMQRENIAAYLGACKYMAFNKASMFETADLFEGNNMVLVIENIFELAKRAQRKGGLPQIKEVFKKGGYELSAVESSSGSHSPSSSLHETTSTSSETPSTSSETPSTSSETPSTSSETPSTSSETPSTSHATPSTSEEAPTSTETAEPTESEADGPATFCPDCGQKRDGLSRFCADCGHQFEDGEPSS